MENVTQPDLPQPDLMTQEQLERLDDDIREAQAQLRARCREVVQELACPVCGEQVKCDNPENPTWLRCKQNATTDARHALTPHLVEMTRYAGESPLDFAWRWDDVSSGLIAGENAKELRQCNERIEEQNERLQVLGTQIGDLKSRLFEKETECAALRRECTELAAERARLKSKLEAACQTEVVTEYKGGDAPEHGDSRGAPPAVQGEEPQDEEPLHLA